MRQSVPLAAVAVTSLIAGLASATPAVAAPPDVDWTARATSTYESLQRYFFLGPDQNNLYQENYPKQTGDNPYSYLFPYREATAAAVSLNGAMRNSVVHRPDLVTRFSTFARYWTATPGTAGYVSYVAPPIGTGGDLFYDDNAIVGLEFVRGFHATRDRGMIGHAVDAFAAVTRGWDTDPSRSCPGGEHWAETSWNNIRAANVTGLGAELAAHLYLVTHDRLYLDWARKLLTWNQTCLRQSAGLYWNDMGYDGTVNRTLWTYNSGAMIGAATLLFRATGDRAYLNNAVTEAQGALDYWTAEDRLYQQPAIFNSYLFNNLLLLDSQAPNPRYRSVIQDYADRVWSSNRDPATGLFHFQPSGGGAPDPGFPAQTLEQSAVVQILSALAWSPRDYWRIA
jgi:Glycosyl hydrolase family 76